MIKSWFSRLEVKLVNSSDEIEEAMQDEINELRQAIEQAERVEPVMIYHGGCTIDCGEHGHHNMEMLKLIQAGSKLYTHPPTAPAVPKGWKLVPEEPTNEWVNSLAGMQKCSLEEVPFAAIHQCISELLEAAPTAPAQPLTDFDMRGVLASNLLCWNRLTEAETQNLISFFETVRSKTQTQPDMVSGKIFDRFVALNESNASRVLKLEDEHQALSNDINDYQQTIDKLEAENKTLRQVLSAEPCPYCWITKQSVAAPFKSGETK